MGFGQNFIKFPKPTFHRKTHLEVGFAQKAPKKLHIFACNEVAGFAGDLVGLRKKAGFARLFSSRLWHSCSIIASVYRFLKQLANEAI